jgi:hypothetical protein
VQFGGKIYRIEVLPILSKNGTVTHGAGEKAKASEEEGRKYGFVPKHRPLGHWGDHP